MYGPEPHPASPDMNFDSGKLAANFWSTERQANTYDERLEAARAIRDVTHPLQVSTSSVFACLRNADSLLGWGWVGKHVLVV